jgi:hypothetical protein
MRSPERSQDGWTGAYPRWHVGFNITMLRLVSFGADAHWARTRCDPAPEVGVLASCPYRG